MSEFRPPLQTQVARGVTPSGTHLVSARNLEITRAPGVAAPDLYAGPPAMTATMTQYALGWMIGDYRGHRVISHAGGTAGFTALMAFLPEAGVGLVVLSNALRLRPVPLAFQYSVLFRLWEILFERPRAFDAALAEAATTPVAVDPGHHQPGQRIPISGTLLQR